MTQLTNLVQFPGLGLSFHLNRVAFSIGGVHIYWYGVCIAVGLCLALVFAFRHSIEFGVDPDGMVDVILIGVVLGIVSARAYYVAMAPFKYTASSSSSLESRHFKTFFSFWRTCCFTGRTVFNAWFMVEPYRSFIHHARRIC